MPKLIAHRGQNANFPENTLESFVAALACGSNYLECDVQLTADHIPVISHDITLLETAELNINIAQSLYSELSMVSVGEAKRFGDTFPSTKLPKLADVIALLQSYPDSLIFIELKQESFDYFGIELFVDRVLNSLPVDFQQCVLISFNLQAIQYLKSKSALKTGWVIENLDETSFKAAGQLSPEFLFTHHHNCLNSSHDFSADNWSWAAYETSDPLIVEKLIKRGVDYIETDNICKLLKIFPNETLTDLS